MRLARCAIALLALAACEGAAGDQDRVAPSAPASPPAARPGPAEISSVLLWKAGTSVPAPDDSRDALRDEAVALLQGCADRERRLVTEADWAAARATELALEVRFEPPATLVVAGHAGLRVSALIVDFGARTRLLARDGDVLYSAFSGCDAARLATLRAKTEQAAGS